MKLVQTVCAVWSILYAAEAVMDLQCWTCDKDDDAQCTVVVLKNCTMPDEICVSSTLESTVGPRIVRRQCMPIDRCGNNVMNVPFPSLHTNLGPGNGQLTGICCNTSGCNDKFFKVPENPFTLQENSLRCFTCESPFDLLCHRINFCRGRRTQCVNATVIVPDGRLQRATGCASPSWCEGRNLHLAFFSPLITLSTFIDGPNCCAVDFCNGNVSVLNPVVAFAPRPQAVPPRANPIVQPNVIVSSGAGATAVPLPGARAPLLLLLSILPLTPLICTLRV